MSVVNLLEFDLDGLAAFCEQLGEKRFRATQLFRWIHQKGAADFGAMTDLAKSLRDKLAGSAEVKPLPVAIPAFSGGGRGADISQVISGNLERSGLFQPLRLTPPHRFAGVPISLETKVRSALVKKE